VTSCLCCSYTVSCTEVTEQHSDVTYVYCCSGCWWADRQHIMHISISLYHWRTLFTVSRQPEQMLTVCALFAIIVWVSPYPDIGSKIGYPDFQISINNPSPGVSCCPTALHCFYLSDSFCCLLHGFLNTHPFTHSWCDTARHRPDTFTGRCRRAVKK